jgi:uroporphyrinogen-III synthase
VPKLRELESSLVRVEKQLHLYQRISRFHSRSIPFDEALQSVSELVADFMEADSCLIYLLGGQQLVLCAAKGAHPDAIGQVRLRLDEGLTGWVARERRVLAISREAYHDPRFKYFRDLPEDAFEAFLSAPVIVRSRVAGVINIQHRQVHAHSGDEIEMVTAVGELVGSLAALALLAPDALASADFAGVVAGQGSLFLRS